MKLAIFAVLMMMAMAWAIPVDKPEVKESVEPKDLESSQPGEDLKTDSTFGLAFYRPYYSYGWGYRPIYRNYVHGYGGWGDYDDWGSRYYYW